MSEYIKAFLAENKLEVDQGCPFIKGKDVLKQGGINS